MPPQRDGLAPSSKVYEFPFELEGRAVTMVVTSVLGHLMGMDFAPPFDNWTHCSPVQLFTAPVVKTVAAVRLNEWLAEWLACLHG